MNRNERISIIGAGMAGLACAKALRRKGAAVTVFDKSRGLGGRLASRRGDGVQFDHGAQYISARTPGFTAFMEACLADGAAALWRPDIHDGRESKGGSDKWYVGLPGMSGLVKPLADGIDVKLSQGRRGMGFRFSRRHDGTNVQNRCPCDPGRTSTIASSWFCGRFSRTSRCCNRALSRGDGRIRRAGRTLLRCETLQ